MYVYLTLAEVVALHAKATEVGGDGPFALADRGLVESALEHAKNDDFYPTLANKIAHIFYSLARSQCFLNGNKRAALSSAAQMMLSNGHVFETRNSDSNLLAG